MELTILGSGTAIPVPDRFPAGCFVRASGLGILVDCGPGTLRRLAQAGFALDDIDAVLLTHFHTDHCADLGPLLFALHGPAGDGRRPLSILAAPGLCRFLRLLAEIWPWTLPKGYELMAREIGEREFRLGPVEILALPIRHTAQSLGYRLRDGTGTIAFSGDADECEELVDLARGADLFVCDSAFPDGAKVDGHLTPGLAGRIARRAGARTLVLTHFYPECEGRGARAGAAAEFDGAIVPAEDLMVLRTEV
ncbi:MAG: MBL fold metallo-hydrolase [Planctomycetota bacterium]